MIFKRIRMKERLPSILKKTIFSRAPKVLLLRLKQKGGIINMGMLPILYQSVAYVLFKVAGFITMGRTINAVSKK
jgi:hypothetical protein